MFKRSNRASRLRLVIAVRFTEFRTTVLTPEKKMTSPDQERWLRVKEKLRAEVGEDIFQSWFARMDLERIEVNTAHLSVPTRFLKSWIQSHYTDRVLACWQGEN